MCAWPSTSARTKNWTTEILTDADLEGQLDILHTYFNDSLNASTGHAHTGGTADGPKITLTTGVQGTLPLANGGTGVTTLAALLNLVYPVGSVYINVSDSTNPGTLLGFGTWVALGAGRVIVGFDSGDTDFDAAGETGGAKTFDISHTHGITWATTASSSFGTLEEGGAGNNYTIPANTNTGGSATISIMPKYVTCYTWKRTV